MPCLTHRRRPPLRQRLLAGALAGLIPASQLALPPSVEAAALGSSNVSAGSVAPPNATAIQSFQPDLFTGRATTSIPIAVPPGRKGMQPSLALSYSSSGRNSWVGVGWGLDLGYIERSTKNGPPAYGVTDTFSFMFQGVASELVQIIDGSYRAKDEGLFLRFRQVAGSWEVHDKSGTLYRFGQTTASQIIDGTKVFRWALDAVEDTNGNGLTVSYSKDANQLYPARIVYTTHYSGEPTPLNRVDFILESTQRPDIDVSYRAGFEIQTTKRLVAIETSGHVNGVPTLARRYELSYAASPATGRSRLKDVVQVGSDGTTRLPATAFNYENSGVTGYSLIRNEGTTSTAAWNVRVAAHSFRHEVFACGEDPTRPYAGLNWNGSQIAPPTVTVGCVIASTESSGAFHVSSCQDRYVHAWTWVYRDSSQPSTLSLSTQNFCVWQEVPGSSPALIGNPSAITLPTGWSLIHLTAHHEHADFQAHQNSNVINQVGLMMPTSQFIPPRLVGDADGNGSSDLILFDAPAGRWVVSLSHNGVFSPGTQWLASFGGSASIPVLGDWNGDGRTDLAISNAGHWQFALSNGSSFQTWPIGDIVLGGNVPFAGDFNGDGLTDLGVFDNGDWRVALNTGSTFVDAPSFNVNWAASYEPLITDFNGDGLTDIGARHVNLGDVAVALSDGGRFLFDRFQTLTGFGPGFTATTADFNGDGLTDVAYHSPSAGQVIYAPSLATRFGAAATLPMTFGRRDPSDTLQVGDFNADGLPDPALFNATTGASELSHSQGTTPDLLIDIDNGVGGSTAIAYQPSTHCDNVCPIERVAKLPFVLPVVNQVIISDGLGNSYRTTHFYREGRYDPATREFRGFGHVESRNAADTATTTKFHQDEHNKGRPYLTELRDSQDRLWSQSRQTWSCTEPYPGVHFTRLERTESSLYDGDETSRTTAQRFAYDDVHGHLTDVVDEGDVAQSGDERTSRTDYALNEAAWVLNKPTLSQTFDANDQVVAQRRFYYDGQAFGAAPIQGNLTKEDEWLDGATESWLATALTYDTFGNVATVTDAALRVTTNTYDAAGTYLTRISNHLGHTRDLEYDPLTGQVTRSIDQNGVATSTMYDTLGRVISVAGPLGSSIEYEYDLVSRPSRTTTHTRITSNDADRITVHIFVDGLGRTVQTRTPAKTPAEHLVTGAVAYDALGRVISQWAPYADIVSSIFRPHTGVAGLAPPVTYAYDPVGRLLTTTVPDDPTDAVSSTSYDDWSVTTTDANGHRTRRTSDAYGRLITVEEFNGTDTYTTTYAYDALGNLAQVTDALGNMTRIVYDSFGRKTAMDDPDMGHWTYEYDAVDNLKKQTDARGVATTFTYDSLNRVTQKAYTIPVGSGIADPGAVSYFYDEPNATLPFTKGKLTRVQDSSGESRFEYDTLGRLVKETKIVTGDATSYTIARSYDLLGRLVSLTYPDAEVANYTYNLLGGIDAITLGGQIIASNLDYNPAGQLTTITYGNGVTTDYIYHQKTLRLEELRTTGPGGPLQNFAYQFDPVGNITRITDAVYSGTQEFEYDDLNRLTHAVGAYGDVRYGYNAIGNMLEKEGVQMTYGESAGPHAVTSTSAGLRMTYDGNGNLRTKGPATGWQADLATQHLTYDAENRLAAVDTAQEARIEVTFKPGWNFFSLPVIPENGAVAVLLPSFAQDFEQIAKFEQPTNTFTHHVGNPTFDQFAELEYGVGYQVYAKREIVVPFEGQLPSRPLSQTLAGGWHFLPAVKTESAPASQVFGSLSPATIKRLNATTGALEDTTQVEPGQAYWVHLTASATWTPPLPQDVTTRFAYDGDGGRVKQITATKTTTYLGEAFEKDSLGQTTKYVFAGSQRLAAKDSIDGLRFYHTDHLGSTNLVTTSTGTVAQLTEYVPFGAVTRQEGPKNLPHKFTGQRQDDGTGLILFPARAYDPELGRFVSPDPTVQHPGDPQDLNRYAYVRNNPGNFVDPTGFGWLRRLLSAVVATIATAILPEAAPLWWSLAAGAAGAVAGDVLGARIEQRNPSAPQTSLPMTPGVSAPADTPTAAMASLGTQPSFIGAIPGTGASTADALAEHLVDLALLALGVYGMARVAIGRIGALTIRQATSRAAVAEVADTALTDSLFNLVHRNVPAIDGQLFPAPSTVVRFATSPFRTGLETLGQRGGSWATTLEQADTFGGLRLGSWHILVGPRAVRAANQLALYRIAPWRRFLLFGRTISLPAGTRAQYGFAQPIEGLVGMARELFFN